ncbi:MAG: hypothetical protein HZB46_03860 [Solirubrobacterales bacterium]|nr:hypothetical protein [Solirubrobacterales bacterium]
MADDVDAGDLADLDLDVDVPDTDLADAEVIGDLPGELAPDADPELAAAVQASPIPDPLDGDDIAPGEPHFGASYRYDVEGETSSGHAVGGDAAGHLYDKETGEELSPN